VPQEWLAAGGRVLGTTRWGLDAVPSRDGRDASNNPTGSLAVSDMAVGAGWHSR
jgi:hypothetical protein